MPVKVVQITNSQAIVVPELKALVQKALDASLFAGAKTDEVLEEVAGLVADPGFGVFVAVEDGKFKGIMVIALPRDRLLTVPQVTIFYSEGSKACKEELIRVGLAWGVNKGFTRFWAINVSGRSDTVWVRAFDKAGSAKRIGSIMEFAVGG